MKIAIYGDSYADYNYRPNNNKTWMQYLEDKDNKISVFANSGSSFYFSVKRYLETNNNFDKKIFFVTYPGRLYLPQILNEQKHIAGLSTAQLLFDSVKNPFDKKVYAAVVDYLMHVQNYEEELLKHYCMLDRIKHDKNLLLIPVALDSFEKYNGTTMQQISQIDYDFYHLSTYPPKKDLRCCHMNQQNNKIFADIIHKWIVNDKFDFDLSSFVLPTESENKMFDSTLYI